MAFTLVNKTPFPTAAVGEAGVLHYELADQGATGDLKDTGIADCKFIRVRLVVKSGMGNTNTFTFRVKVDNTAALASPEVVAWSPTMTFVTNDTLLSIELYGASQTGFRYFQILGTDSGGTAVYDAYVDVY